MASAMKSLPKNTVVVCSGSACRRAKGDSHQTLCKALLAAGLDVKTSRCLGVCAGPVVAAPIKDRVEILSEVRGSNTIHDLTAAIAEGRAKRIKSRRVTGGRRDQARRRALQATN
jgi:hypothetical protein